MQDSDGENLPQRLKEYLSPAPEFAEKAKTTYLAVFDAHHEIRSSRTPFLIMRVSLGAALVLMLLVGAGSVYADNTNVPADSVLYPLKRIGESVQLVAATDGTAANLQAEFAARRRAEITDLQSREPSSTLIAPLTHDFMVMATESLQGAAASHLHGHTLLDFCGRFAGAIGITASDTAEKFVASDTVREYARECLSIELSGDASTTVTSSLPMKSDDGKKGGAKGNRFPEDHGIVGDMLGELVGTTSTKTSSSDASSSEKEKGHDVVTDALKAAIVSSSVSSTIHIDR